MRLAFKKLFESGPDSAKTDKHSAVIQEVESADGERCGRRRLLATRTGRRLDLEIRKSLGMQFRHNRPAKRNAAGAAIRAIEFSFRTIEVIRTQFHDALSSIDQTLVEIERTRVANLEAEQETGRSDRGE